MFNLKLIGFFSLLLAIILGFGISGGPVAILWQPVELLVILGGGFGEFVFSNPVHVIKGFFSHFNLYFKSSHFNHELYQDLLDASVDLSSVIRSKGYVKVIDELRDSDSLFFQNYSKLDKDADNKTFFIDVLENIMSAGSDKRFEATLQVDSWVANNVRDTRHLSSALQKTGESMPAFGIMAAILGIILTMGLIDQGVSVIGEAMSAALVGAFLGLLLGYGLFIPMSSSVRSYSEEQEAFQENIVSSINMIADGTSPKIIETDLKKIFPRHIRKALKK